MPIIYFFNFTAVLRDISAGTSYQTVRLVFRPYTQVLPASCTSARHRSFTHVSVGFVLLKYSSQSFGSHPYYLLFYLELNYHFNNNKKVSFTSSSRNMCDLLGPCFNTGRTCALTSLVLSLFPSQMLIFHLSFALLIRYRSLNNI